MEVRVLLEAPGPRARTVDPDAAFVAAARDEPQAFLALYDRYFDRVLGYVRLQIRDEPICEDVVSGASGGTAPLRAGCSRSRGTRVRDVQRRPAAVPLSGEAALGLRYGAGLAFDEIGTIVGAAPGTVRVRMHRILEQLRRLRQQIRGIDLEDHVHRSSPLFPTRLVAASPKRGDAAVEGVVRLPYSTPNDCSRCESLSSSPFAHAIRWASSS
jgi:sigma-70-like protein